MEIPLNPIGVVHSGFASRKSVPIYPKDVKEVSTIEILPKFRDCLLGIETLSHIFVLCWFHETERNVQTVHLRGDPGLPTTGVLSTRAPCRPNPISLTLVELVEVSDLHIKVRGLDAIDGTPVVDIRPPDLC